MNAPVTILALSASVSPTLAIHLLRPLQGLPGINIQMLTQEALAQIVKNAPPGVDGLSLAAMILNQVRPALVFSSRYNGAMAEDFLAASRRMGLPFVFHLDDNLMEVSADQGAEKVAYYSHPKRLQALRAQMEQASVAYFSTEALRDRMLELGIEVAKPHVGPICAAVDLLPLGPVSASLTFGYAASGGHNEDLKLALPGIVAALEQHPQARFELIGSLEHMPPELVRFGERVKHERRFIAYDDYLRDLQRRNWVLGLTPLCDNPFTRMKTYTKWVEYTAAGLPVIASDHPIYRDCCADGAALLVKDADWASALPGLLGDVSARQAMVAKARARVGQEYSVARLRAQLLEVFRLAGLTL
ncbi:glycosyltransferase [Ferrovibrio sp.]|uniref:glycosyltransferase family protein n=1 Tax=Ferrovibrio sp. TaxID=1917215 RepID=UPI000CC2B4C7|nr:glycosyltransferase [Ferrovibrio sp.]PJI42252.1 MAG: glycosyltransferase [Ferrovibrio sp.]